MSINQKQEITREDIVLSKSARFEKEPSLCITSFVNASRDTKLIDFIGFRADVGHSFSKSMSGFVQHESN